MKWTACAVLVLVGAAGSARAQSITVFQDEKQRGERRTYTREERDLGSWSRRITSFRIERGSWELCRETNFRGCRTFDEGEGDLAHTDWNDGVRSLRPVVRGRDEGRGREQHREAAYSRKEAFFIANRIYGALLGRRVDRSGAEQAVPRIEGGRVRAEVEAIVRSPEFRHDRMSPEEMLEQIYQGMLGRAVDESGRRSYQREVRDGHYAQVVMSILESSEFKRMQRDAR